MLLSSGGRTDQHPYIVGNFLPAGLRLCAVCCQHRQSLNRPVARGTRRKRGSHRQGSSSVVLRHMASVDYIFAYGSLFCAASRRSSGVDGPVYLATLLPCFGHRRSWNFRSSTGFTALGLCPCEGDEEGEGGDACADSGSSVCGVLFPADCALATLDLREKGYSRVHVPPLALRLEPPPAPDSPAAAHLHPAGAVAALATKLEACDPDVAVWVYVPGAPCTAEASVDYPICQTYVDTVLGRRAPP